MSNTRTLEDAVISRIADACRGLHVGMPGRVVAYDSATQRADVQPLIMRGFIDETGARDAEALPVLTNVPVKFQRSASFTMTFAIAKGDLVHLEFMDFSIDEWLKEGGLRNPADDRCHSISDAVAYPGLYHSATDQVHATDAVLAGNLRLGSKDASELVALQSEVKAIRDDLHSHEHFYIPYPGGVAGTPVTTTGGPSVSDPGGATKVWVE